MMGLKVNGKVNDNINQSVNAFIATLKFAHDDLGLSYGYLAKLLDVSPPTVYYWAKGLKRPSNPKAKKCFMVLLDLIEANTYRLPEVSDFSLNHMGPPENHFSFKAVDDTLMKKVLGMLTYYEGVLGIGNKVLLDTAAYYVRSYMSENRVKRSEARMLALAALKVAMLKCGIPRNVAQFIDDPEVFSKFFTALSIKYLSDISKKGSDQTEQTNIFE
ncbi:MAG: helix-turn-helix transcriptional regulator [Nitrososphaeria archaeon]